MAIPPELISKAIEYTRRFPQTIPLSKEIYKYTKKFTREEAILELGKIYPRYESSIELLKYNINRAAIKNRPNDILLLVELGGRKFNHKTSIQNTIFEAESSWLSNTAKYAIAVCHRFGYDEIADHLIRKYSPHIYMYNIRESTDESLYDRFGEINVMEDLILITRMLRMNEFKDRITTFIKQYRNKYNFKLSANASYIGNVDKTSWYLLSDGEIDGFDYDKIYIPIDTTDDIYTFLVKHYGIKNNKTLSFIRENFKEITKIPIATKSLGAAILLYKNELPFKEIEPFYGNMLSIPYNGIILGINKQALSLPDDISKYRSKYRNVSDMMIEMAYQLGKITLDQYIGLNVGIK